MEIGSGAKPFFLCALLVEMIMMSQPSGSAMEWIQTVSESTQVEWM